MRSRTSLWAGHVSSSPRARANRNRRTTVGRRSGCVRYLDTRPQRTVVASRRPVRLTVRSRRGYPRPLMAAPIRKGEEAEVRIDSLAYGGNGVGRLDGFVVFVRGGLPGDLVRARATKVKRGFCGGDEGRAARAGPESRRGTVPPLRDLRRLPLPGSCLRGAGRGQGDPGAGGADASRRLRGAARRGDRARTLDLRLPEQARVLVRGWGGRSRARVPPSRPLGRGDRRPGVPADDRRRQRDPRSRQAVGTGGRARAVRPGHANRVPAAPRRP